LENLKKRTRAGEGEEKRSEEKRREEVFHLIHVGKRKKLKSFSVVLCKIIHLFDSDSDLT